MYLLAHPDGGDEGCLEIVGDAHKKSLSAGYHCHPSCEVTDHVVGCQVHAMDVWVHGEILEREEGGGKKRVRGWEWGGE